MAIDVLTVINNIGKTIKKAWDCGSLPGWPAWPELGSGEGPNDPGSDKCKDEDDDLGVACSPGQLHDPITRTLEISD